jgi:hypothetical protein
VIAATVGATCGAVAGFWPRPADTRNEPPAVTAAPGPIAAPVGPVSRPPPEPAPVEPKPKATQPAQTEPASRGVGDIRDAVQRARVLAQRADVKGLVALREEVARRAEEAGEKESSATKGQLDEIDRYLTEARVLRLKLDAAEFRRGAVSRIVSQRMSPTV